MKRLWPLFFVLMFPSIAIAQQYAKWPVTSGGGGSGTVTSITAGTGLSGGTITTTGTISLSVPVVIASGGTNATSFTANADVFYNGTSFASIPNNNVSDSGGAVYPEFVSFSLPGPRVVQNDNTNWFIMPWTGKIVKAWAVAKTGPTGAAFIVDIQKSTNSGLSFTSIWSVTPSNKLQIAASSVSGNQTSFDTSTFNAGDLLRIDIDQIGSTVAGSDVSVQLSVATRNQ